MASATAAPASSAPPGQQGGAGTQGGAGEESSADQQGSGSQAVVGAPGGATAAQALTSFAAAVVTTSTAATPAAVPSATAPASPATSPPAEQLTRVIAPVVEAGDGSTSVTLSLHPEELGEVRVQLRVDGSGVDVSIHAAEPATRALLSGQLDDLRSALSDAGLAAATVQVGGGSAGSGGRHQTHMTPSTAPVTTTTDPAADAATTDLPAASAPGSTVDLRI